MEFVPKSEKIFSNSPSVNSPLHLSGQKMFPQAAPCRADTKPGKLIFAGTTSNH
jgi:hypothetical protein